MMHLIVFISILLVIAILKLIVDISSVLTSRIIDLVTKTNMNGETR